MVDGRIKVDAQLSKTAGWEIEGCEITVDVDEEGMLLLDLVLNGSFRVDYSIKMNSINAEKLARWLKGRFIPKPVLPDNGGGFPALIRMEEKDPYFGIND